MSPRFAAPPTHTPRGYEPGLNVLRFDARRAPGQALLVAALLALLSACGGGSKPADKKPAPEPPKPAAPTPATPTPPTAPTSAATTAAVTPAASPEGAALFYPVEANRVVPLACYDAKAKAFLHSAGCLPMAPKGTAISFPGGGSGKVTAQERYDCEAAGTTAEALVLSGGPNAEADRDYAFWPEGLAKSLTRAPAIRDAYDPGVSLDLGATIPKAERDAVEKAVRATKPKGGKKLVEIRQRVAADLDGDGAEDTLYAVVVQSATENDGVSYPFSGLLWAEDGDMTKLSILSTSEYELYEVVAVTDLNGDKAAELLLAIDYYEGMYRGVVRLLPGGKLEDLGGWGCGA